MYCDASIGMLTSMSLSLNSAGIGIVRVITPEVGTATAAWRIRVPELRHARLIASATSSVSTGLRSSIIPSPSGSMANASTRNRFPERLSSISLTADGLISMPKMGSLRLSRAKLRFLKVDSTQSIQPRIKPAPRETIADNAPQTTATSSCAGKSLQDCDAASPSRLASPLALSSAVTPHGVCSWPTAAMIAASRPC